MDWWMNLFPNTSRRFAFRVWFLAALLPGFVNPAYSQQTLEGRYQQAMDSFKGARMEDACEIFSEIYKEKPDYEQTRGYMGVACSEVARMKKMEEDLYNQGAQLYGQGRLDDAKVKFQQADKVALKNPPHRSQIRRYLADIDIQQREDSLFQEAKKSFNEKNYEVARTRFRDIFQAHGRMSDEANKYLARIDGLMRSQQAAQRIESKNTPSGNPGTSASTGTANATQGQAAGQYSAAGVPPGQFEQSLRLGLSAYFNGRMDEAQGYLSDYVHKQGPKQELAYFFRGAAHAGLFYLSGEKDAQEKNLALADFRSANTSKSGFEPPENYVSPKILALYSEAVHGTSP